MAGNLANTPQFPGNLGGTKGQHGFIGSQKTFFTGSTGLVATSYGIPGMGATRVSTGTYNLFFPPTVGVDFYPGVQAPSGHSYSVNISDVQPTSGTAKMQIGRFGGAGSSGNFVPSLAFVPHNPVSGTIVNLLTFVSTRVAY